VENELKEDLLSDFLWNELNLAIFMMLRRGSLSLATKVHLLLMVLQGVRYINLFGIVHLDLKPGNLMISQSLQVKIIDFGESYHPGICTRGSSIPPKTQDIHRDFPRPTAHQKPSFPFPAKSTVKKAIFFRLESSRMSFFSERRRSHFR
jgi:serine/threonine protein kinase